MAKKDKIKKKRTTLQKTVNVFLYTGIGIMILIFMLLGFSQTATFREYLRNFVIEKADDALNGKINIGKIDGTLFTSLVLRNTTVSMGSDTLLNAGIIEVKTRPLQIFSKTIYIRKFELKDARISLLRDGNGRLNISELFPPSKPDSVHSPFQFKIKVPDFKLSNVSFSLQNVKNSGSRREYDSLNMQDFRIRDINLSMDAAADLKNHNVSVKIGGLSCSPNLKFFNLKNFSGQFLVSRSGINISGLKIITDSSRIDLDADVSNLDIFDSTFAASLDKAKINLNLNANNFNFNDLASVVPSVNMLNGSAALRLNTEGSLEDLRIRNLIIDYRKTHLQLAGNVLDLDKPAFMVINANFKNSQINQPDLSKLLPKFGIPVFENLGLIKFDTLKFAGNPQNFKTTVAFTTPKGSAILRGRMDFKQKPADYDIRLYTRNLDLSPFIGYNTSFNTACKITGQGFSPAQLAANIRFRARNSYFNGNPVDSLRLNAEAKDKNLTYSLVLKSSMASSDLKGKFDFTDSVKTSYDLSGTVNNLNLAKFTPDTAVKSNLNFDVDASGDHFNLDKINLFLNLHLNKSLINGINIDSARTIVDLRSNDNGKRIINIISDLADITFEGNFSLNQSVNFLVRESKLISSSFKNKIYQLMNPDSLQNYRNIIAADAAVKNKNLKPFVPENIQYLVEFKNFDLLSLLFKDSHLRLDGNISGQIKNTADSANITLNTKFNYIKYWSLHKVFFLSNLDLKLGLQNKLEDSSFSGINTSLNVKTDRLFAGKDFRKLFLDFKLDKEKADINLSGQMENKLKAGLAGSLDLSSRTIKTDFRKLSLSYDNYNFSNKGNIGVEYSPDKITINDFKLFHNGGFISINGNLSRNNQQDLKILIKGIQGKDLSADILKVNSYNSLGTNINISGEIKGTLASPLITMTADADSISFRKTNFGFLKSTFKYLDRNLNVDLKFLDTTLNKNAPPLVLQGNIPIDLSFISGGKKSTGTKQVDLTLTASNFNLGALGNMVPKLNRLRGSLTTNLHIGGTLQNLNPVGDLTVKDADFIAEVNNMEYTAGLKLNIKNQKITVENLSLANAPGTKDGGSISGSGYVDLKNFELSSSDFELNGKLKVLSDASKAVSPSLYGDLVISTDGNIVFNSDGNSSTINAPIVVQDAKLTFAPTQSAYQNSAENFIYRFAIDTAQTDTSEMDFASLVKLSQSNGAVDSDDINEKPLALNYIVNVKVKNEAVLRFILSKELNQNLTAIINGSFQYENMGGKTNAQGELTLMEGSTLEFLKTFEAAGTIRFESELNNPYLNIVATYKNYYTAPDAEGKEEQVAVEIKLNGPLKDLSKNLIQDKNNISVLMGADNITNNKPDPTKDASDAVMFILTGKFPGDLTQQQQSQAVAQSSAFSSTATSLAGSLLGGFLNHYLGDYVRGVELSSVGSTTKFNLVGKVKNFRYSIGGSTDVFQDLSQANVKIEYPIFQNFLLRVERKEAITQTTASSEMINELGLKYRFEF